MLILVKSRFSKMQKYICYTDLYICLWFGADSVKFNAQRKKISGVLNH